MPIISGLKHRAVYVFGAVELRGDGTLVFDRQSFHLPPKELEVLRLLLDSPGVVVSKTALLDAVWRGADIGEESLTRCIYMLRKLLGAYKKYIATVYGKGYRLTCSVHKKNLRVATAKRAIEPAPIGCVATHPGRLYAVVSHALSHFPTPAGVTSAQRAARARPSVRVFGVASAFRSVDDGTWR